MVIPGIGGEGISNQLESHDLKAAENGSLSKTEVLYSEKAEGKNIRFSLLIDYRFLQSKNFVLMIPVFPPCKYSACHIIGSQQMFDDGQFFPYPGFYYCASLLECFSTRLYFKSTLESFLSYVTFSNHCSYRQTLKTFFCFNTLVILYCILFLCVSHICIYLWQLNLKRT